MDIGSDRRLVIYKNSTLSDEFWSHRKTQRRQKKSQISTHENKTVYVQRTTKSFVQMSSWLERQARGVQWSEAWGLNGVSVGASMGSRQANL